MNRSVLIIGIAIVAVTLVVVYMIPPANQSITTITDNHTGINLTVNVTTTANETTYVSEICGYAGIIGGRERDSECKSRCAKLGTDNYSIGSTTIPINETIPRCRTVCICGKNNVLHTNI
jgi:hypothetical protein